ncbi:MAG: Zn-ribbon domain-containing OB-fold protein [Rhodobacteraceae bacterium]|nr:Zn-ribbon domain-containing OB-fold protein [Paracoccaceae bacterium]MBR9820231.1 Zn-ribbon domain-containing OB-fold protein [Paracoccaceae bacterium]
MSQRPVPTPDAETAPFWEGAEAGQLKIQRCTACDHAIFYPRLVCPACMTEEPAWVDASGQATIHALTTVHRTGPAFREDVPFAVALVELAEGPRMMTRILSEQPEALRIGDAVQVTFVPQPEGPPLPFFAPC